MSNIQRIENVHQIVKLVEPDFNELARIHNAVNFKKEASFALQILNDNPFLTSVAMKNQDSLKNAIINVAAVGLSLNPVKKLAYLVPRDGKVILDISYMGFIHLAAEVGAIKWVAAEIVCKNDVYKFLGHGKQPIHEFDPFASASDRGDAKGGYCLAKTHDDEFILTQMNGDEILDARERSPSWQAHVKDGKTSPWKTDENEMIRKTLIRRAHKIWPMVNTRKAERFVKALDLTSEPLLDPPAVQTPPKKGATNKGKAKEKEPPPTPRAVKLQSIRDYLSALNRTEKAYIEHLIRVCRRDIKKLEDLTDIEIGQAISALDQIVSKEMAKQKAKEKKNENAS